MTGGMSAGRGITIAPESLPRECGRPGRRPRSRGARVVRDSGRRVVMPSPVLPSEPPAEPGVLDLGVLPELQLVPVPAGWPPYDCDVHGGTCPAVEVRAGGSGARASGGDSDGGGAGARPDVAGDAGARRPGVVASGESPAAAGETTAWPRQFGQVIVEVLAGARSPRQLTAWTTDHARAQVDALVRDLASAQRPRIQRIITSRPTARVVEMTMVVRFGPRSRALALRFEQAPARKAAPGLPARAARWLCTDIEAG